MIIPPIRGQDAWGDGAFHAKRTKLRDGVKIQYLHEGLDYKCYPGSTVLSLKEGVVTKIGYPYNPNGEKGHLRYVQITDLEGYNARYFYVKTHLNVGTKVYKYHPIGKTQELGKIFPGISEHFHLEIEKHGKKIDPNLYGDIT